MNIQFEDTTLKDVLDSSTLETFEFGSSLFGLDDNNSDYDRVCIYSQFDNEAESFYWGHHNLQYKDKEGDIVYTSLKNFVRNIINGDCTYFFEILHGDEIKDSSLSFLVDYRHFFYGYSTIKSYIGMAKRDLKYAIKNSKRFSHAYRSYITAEKLLDRHYYENTFSQEDFEVMSDLKYDRYEKSEKWELLADLKDRVKDLRSTLNTKLDNGEIQRFMDIRDMKELDRSIYQYTKSDYYKSKVQKYLDMSLFYEAIENGISYD